VLLAEGRPTEAEKLFDESLATFRAIGAKFPAAVALNDIGGMMFNRGDLREAQTRYEASLSLFGELGEKAGTATVLTNIAEVLTCRGDLATARTMHQESLAINRSIGDKAGIAYDLFRIGEIFVLGGDFIAARNRYDEALKIQTEIDDRLAAADTRVALAELAIEQGRAAEAESGARQAEEILRTEGAAEHSTLALAVVADALLRQKKREEAKTFAERAWTLAAKTPDRRIRFGVAIIAARVRAASGKTDDVESALRLMETTRSEASKSLFYMYALEARLVAGVIEREARRASAKAHLIDIEKEARRNGFGGFARRAAAATQGRGVI
jgi:tetratricopeptide (TPR) repeat protein